MTNDVFEAKLKQANRLKADIENLDSFISLANGTIKPNRPEGLNIFRKLEIASDVCTGSQSPTYDACLFDHDIIKSFILAGLEELIKIRDNKKEQAVKLFTKEDYE